VSQITNEQLFSFFKLYDPVAENKVFEMYWGKLVGTCSKYLSNIMDVEDCVQVAITNVFKVRGLLNDFNHLNSLMFKAAVNKCLDCYKSKRVADKRFRGLRLDNIIYPNVFSDDTDIQVFVDKMDLLTNREREVFVLMFLYGWKARKIARMFDITDSGVRQFKQNIGQWGRLVVGLSTTLNRRSPLYLSGKQNMAYTLHAKGLNAKQIAAKMDISAKNVYGLIGRVKAKKQA
jgi:RNA polymerase sigma-70 factor (ECF subfamily)